MLNLTGAEPETKAALRFEIERGSLLFKSKPQPIRYIVCMNLATTSTANPTEPLPT